MTIIQNPEISFGQYITVTDVLVAVRTTIQTWSATYLAEMTRHDQQNPSIQFEALPDFASFPSSLDLSEFVENQLPSCIIVVPGIPSKPHRYGNGLYTVELNVGIGVAVSGQDVETTRKLATLYGAAVRQILLQKSDLGGIASGVVWIKEEYTGTFVRPTDQRTLAVGELEFTFTVDNFANVSSGPLTPLANNNPPTGFPVVEFPSMTVKATQPV